MSTVNKIVEMIEEIEPSKNEVTVELVAWPFSRDLVTAVCISQNLNYEYNRISKQKEEFIVKADSGFSTDVKEMLKLINKEARDSDMGFSAGRNQIVQNIVKKLGVELPKAEKNSDDFLDEKPKAKSVAKKQKSEKVVKISSDKKAPAKVAAKTVKVQAKKSPAKKAASK